MSYNFFNSLPLQDLYLTIAFWTKNIKTFSYFGNSVFRKPYNMILMHFRWFNRIYFKIFKY